jgi:hypothetical protein
MKLRTVVQQAEGRSATGLPIPPDKVAELGPGKRFKVVVTINGDYSYRSSLASMGGQFLIPLSADHRKAAGLAAGDDVDLTIELDEAPREVEVPDDLRAALDAAPAAAAAFAALSYSHQNAHVLSVTGAKAEATRQRRVAAVVDKLTG